MDGHTRFAFHHHCFSSVLPLSSFILSSSFSSLTHRTVTIFNSWSFTEPLPEYYSKFTVKSSIPNISWDVVQMRTVVTTYSTTPGTNITNTVDRMANQICQIELKAITRCDVQMKEATVLNPFTAVAHFTHRSGRTSAKFVTGTLESVATSSARVIKTIVKTAEISKI